MNGQRRKDAETQGREGSLASLRDGVFSSASHPFQTAEDEVGRSVVDAAIEVHREFGGPGLLENVYTEALVWELESRGLELRRQVAVPVVYKDRKLATRLRLDLVVNQLVIVECKAVAVYNRIFEAQVLTYLRLTGLKLGMVINFGERLVSKGIHRVVNGL